MSKPEWRPHVTHDHEARETSIEFWGSGRRKLTFYVTDEGVGAIKSWGPNIHDEMEDVDLGGWSLFDWLWRDD